MIKKQENLAREARRASVDAVKRDIIRSAAKSIFSKEGLDAASMREVAKLAGYTTGAIYFHYTNKEDLYGDILHESLSQLHEQVVSASSRQGQPGEAAGEAFRALVKFYSENPRDLDLSLYLFQGARPRGLSPALNRGLNAKLSQVLNVFREHLAAAGVPAKELDLQVGALFSEMIGSLIAAHTGRLRLIGVDLDAVVEHHISELIARLRRRRPT